MTATHPLKILTWNCARLGSALTDLKLLIEKHNFDIIFISEVKEKRDRSLRGYNSVYTDLGKKPNRQVAFLKKELNYVEYQIKTDHNLQCFTVFNEKDQIDIFHIYREHQKHFKTSALEQIIKDKRSKNFIITGDVNAHHELWGSVNSDSNGKTLVEFINDNDLICLNSGEPTRFDSNSNNQPSHLDITLITQQLYNITEWELGEDLYNSDHLPQFIKINSNPIINNYSNPSSWNFSKAQWNDFYHLTKLVNPQEILSDNTDTFNENLVNFINNCADLTIPKKRSL